jgi:Fe-S cluster assembly protein SufD
MTVHVTKTKAETALSEGFRAIEASLPGSAAVQTLRRDAIGAFAALGLPHRRLEAWKYTDLRTMMTEAYSPATGTDADAKAGAAALAGKGAGLLGDIEAYTMVFVDGALTASNVPAKLNGVTVQPLDKLLAGPERWMADALTKTSEPADGVIALNTAYMSGGFALRIADGVMLDKPIHAVFIGGGNGSAAIATRLIVSVGKGAVVTIVESHVVIARQDNTLTHLFAADGADVTHIKNLHAEKGSVHLANWLVELGANTTYKPFVLATGEGIMRNGMEVTFNGEHSSIDLGSASVCTAAGHADLTMTIDHAVPHCTSRELFKCVLDDKSRAVFQGKVIVRPDAQKTDGKQMAQALMLSPDAEFDSKPELEIYADDVVCGHGSTSAEIDPDLVFYCRARGIPLETARAMLVESFIGEAIDKVENEGLRAALMERARASLKR